MYTPGPECANCSRIVAAYIQECIRNDTLDDINECTLYDTYLEILLFFIVLCEKNGRVLNRTTEASLLYTTLLLSSYAAFIAHSHSTYHPLFHDITVLAFIAAYTLGIILVTRICEVNSILSSFTLLCAASLMSRSHQTPSDYISLQVQDSDLHAVHEDIETTALKSIECTGNVEVYNHIYKLEHRDPEAFL